MVAQSVNVRRLPLGVPALTLFSPVSSIADIFFLIFTRSSKDWLKRVLVSQAHGVGAINKPNKGGTIKTTTTLASKENTVFPLGVNALVQHARAGSTVQFMRLHRPVARRSRAAEEHRAAR